MTTSFGFMERWIWDFLFYTFVRSTTFGRPIICMHLSVHQVSATESIFTIGLFIVFSERLLLFLWDGVFHHHHDYHDSVTRPWTGWYTPQHSSSGLCLLIFPPPGAAYILFSAFSSFALFVDFLQKMVLGGSETGRILGFSIVFIACLIIACRLSLFLLEAP